LRDFIRNVAHAGARTYRAIQFEQHARDTDFLPPAFELIPRLLVLLDDPEVNSDTLAESFTSMPG